MPSPAGWLTLLYARNIQAVRGLRDNIRHAMGPSASAAQVDESGASGLSHVAPGVLGHVPPAGVDG